MAVGSYEMYSVPRVWQPSDLEEAWELRRTLGSESCYVAGGTLLRTQWEAGLARMPYHLISLERISALQGIQFQSTSPGHPLLRIGALATLEECRRNSYSKLLAEACRTIAAPSIRNQGTIGGNISSRVGDAIPAMLVLNAGLVWFDGKELVAESLADWLSAGSVARGVNEHRILVGVLADGVEVDVPSSGERGQRITFYHKVGRREAFVPSLVTVAGCLVQQEDGRLNGVRLAVGGGASLAQRLMETEALLEGEEITPELMRQVITQVKAEWSGFEDAFASAEYRQTAAANLIVSELWTMYQRQNGSGEG